MDRKSTSSSRSSRNYSNKLQSTPEHPEDDDEQHQPTVSNEYVLNVAFISFVIFMALEAVFAVIAGSASMLEDAEAMSVDALTYLFNLCAERIKHRPYSKEELELTVHVREYKRELSRLYLELVPPLLSVSTLVVVTILATKDAINTLQLQSSVRYGEDGVAIVQEDDVDVNLMIIFSALNLLLDILNVFCFARAGQAFGISQIKKPTTQHRFPSRSLMQQHAMANDERRQLLDSTATSTDLDVQNRTQQLANYASTNSSDRFMDEYEPADHDDDDSMTSEENAFMVNLNMCSAWTHVCADTMRSVAVLIAASIAFVLPQVSGTSADSVAAIVVSVIILVSLLPLMQGLYLTARKIAILSKRDPSKGQGTPESALI